MTNATPSWKPVKYRNSKMGQQNFLSSARVGVVFTYDLGTENVDTQNPDFLSKGQATGDGNFSGTTGDADFSGKSILGLAPNTTELVIGAGIKSISAEQQINVTQENALGFFDIVETIEHNVASNTFTLDKAALRLYLLSQVGLAPWGKDVLTGPRLNAYVLDTKERQRGENVGFLKVMGLHIQTNRFSSGVGQVAQENITFKADRFKTVKSIPFGILLELKKQFPWVYTGQEMIGEGTHLV